ncbi:MAG TPA: SDR family oxidoreductase [Nocardioidaceae bacterium]
MGNGFIVVVGAGPGLGAAVAHRFGGGGFGVGLVARDRLRLDAMAGELADRGVDASVADADITDEVALAAAVTRLAEGAGRVDVLHFNPSRFRHKDPLHLSVAELLDDVRLGVGGLLTSVQAARPFMGPGSRVSATGSMAADKPWHEAASLGVQKAALRNLVRSVDATLRGEGVRAMSLTVNGTLAAGTPFAPDRVADALFHAVTSRGDWRVEVPYDG